MNKQSEATLRQWYGDTTAKAFMDYKNGKITEKSLITVMEKNSLIKHPNGLAIDIGINKSGLSESQVNQVIKALSAKGLYVFDERPNGNPCIHVSRSKY